MIRRPLITDVETKKEFRPGDRLLVRAGNLDKNQLKKLQGSVVKFAGRYVVVLVWNCLEFDLVRVRNGKPEWLAGPEDYQHAEPGIANVSCGVVDFEDGDGLVWRRVAGTMLPGQEKAVERFLREWAGKGVEIRNAEYTQGSSNG